MGVNGWKISYRKYQGWKIITKLTQQDSCWRPARVVRYQGWEDEEFDQISIVGDFPYTDIAGFLSVKDKAQGRDREGLAETD